MTEAPVRDPRYAAPRYSFEHRADGAVVIANDLPYATAFQTTNAALDHWAKVAPAAIWLAERAGDGWRRMSFGEAHDRIARLAGALAGLGVGPGRPLMILTGNSIDHALITYAAMRIGAAVAPVSPQYAQAGADLSRLAHAVELIQLPVSSPATPSPMRRRSPRRPWRAWPWSLAPTPGRVIILWKYCCEMARPCRTGPGLRPSPSCC